MEIGRVIFYTGEIMFLCLFVFLSFCLPTYLSFFDKTGRFSSRETAG